MLEKAKIFVVDAGKVIMVISILLWFLSSYGPPGKMNVVKEKYTMLKAQSAQTEYLFLDKQYNAEKLKNSYAGILGQTIEPVIKPLGYDWKIGIALITSFAAREVFVGTMSTLYSVESDDNSTLQQKMRTAVHSDGRKVYTLPTALSLMVFYAFAMQCMSTLAIAKRELKSWKWPLIQLVYMTLLAWFMSFLVYQAF